MAYHYTLGMRGAKILDGSRDHEDGILDVDDPVAKIRRADRDNIFRAEEERQSGVFLAYLPPRNNDYSPLDGCEIRSRYYDRNV